MNNQVFDLTKFTDLYLKDNHKWVYTYYRTFFELKELLDGPVDITQYFVKEVSVKEMLSIIKSMTGLEWFLENNIGSAYVRKKGNQYEVYVENERSPEHLIGTFNDLETALAAKIKNDLFWLNVQNIKI